MPRTQAPAQAPTYLTPAEVAQAWGVSIATVRRRIADGTLPAWRVGPRAIRVRAEHVERMARPIPAGGAG